MKNSSLSPAFLTKSFITNSAIGDLHILPWQTNSIFIIFQVPPKMLSFALICPDLPSISERLFCPKLCHQNPKRGKIRQIDATVSSKNVVEIGVVTTEGFILVFCPINRKLSIRLSQIKSVFLLFKN